MAEHQRENFGPFYRATVVPLRRFLARMVRSDVEAQDLSHDAYQRVYKAMATQDVEKPRAFLYTTARRLALKKIRRQKIAPVQLADEKVVELAPSLAPGVERLVMARQEWAQLEAAIEELPPGCRSVLQLSHRDGLSHVEIGARLEIAVSTVEKQHARALRLLRAKLHRDAPPLRGAVVVQPEGGPRAATS